MPIIEDFSDYDSFPDENHIHYLSLEAPRNPQLYLNREHPQVVEVLNNTGYTGGPPRLRDVLYDYIEHSVWTQLLLQTARDTSPDTGEPEYGWQEDVLDIFIDDLYPNFETTRRRFNLPRTSGVTLTSRILFNGSNVRSTSSTISRRTPRI